MGGFFIGAKASRFGLERGLGIHSAQTSLNQNNMKNYLTPGEKYAQLKSEAFALGLEFNNAFKKALLEILKVAGISNLKKYREFSFAEGNIYIRVFDNADIYCIFNADTTWIFVGNETDVIFSVSALKKIIGFLKSQSEESVKILAASIFEKIVA